MDEDLREYVAKKLLEKDLDRFLFHFLETCQMANSEQFSVLKSAIGYFKGRYPLKPQPLNG
jgi:hypothetical protein